MIKWNTIVLLCACTFTNLQASEKIHVRGWIGGEFALAKKQCFFQNRETVNAFPAALRQEQKAGIFVRSVPTNSPSAQGGLRAGDLILRVNDQVADSLSRFHGLLEPVAPGQPVRLTIWRQGEKQDLALVAGRETFQHQGTLGVGFFYSGRLDLWPNPDFSIFVLGFKSGNERAELHSTEANYIRSVRQAEGKKEDEGRTSQEGWSCWITPFHLGKQRIIVSQEPAESPATP